MARSPLILDRYRVIDQAGSGGYGTVVHAFDTHLKRDVAIKCIELSEDELAAARLEALEARMAAGFGRGRSRGIGRRDGGRWSECGPGCSLGRRCRHGCHRGRSCWQLVGGRLPRRPRFPGGPRRAPSAPIRDGGCFTACRLRGGAALGRVGRCRRRRRRGRRREWEDSLIPWNASTTDFAGRPARARRASRVG